MLCLLVGGLVFAPTAPAASGAPEEPVTECASQVTSGVWALCGTLNPGSSATTGYYFVYNSGASCLAGSRTAGGEKEGRAVKVSIEVSGLAPGTQYAYCLVATNSSGETFGRTLTFTTPTQGGGGGSLTECDSVETCRGPSTPQPNFTPPPSATTGAGGGATQPSSAQASPTKHHASTRAQKLAAALRACHRDKTHARRVACERLAHSRYGPVSNKRHKR